MNYFGLSCVVSSWLWVSLVVADTFGWVVVDGFGWMQMVSGGFEWFQMVSCAFRWLPVDSGGFRWFAVSAVPMISQGFCIVLNKSYIYFIFYDKVFKGKFPQFSSAIRELLLAEIKAMVLN